MKTYLRTLILLFFGLLAGVTACHRDDPREFYEKPIDPAKDPSGFSRALRIEGRNEGGDMPLNPLSALRITKAQPSATASKGASLYVPFVFSSNSPVRGVYLQVQGADNYWDIPATAQQVSTDTYVFSVKFPKNILDGSATLRYAAYDADRRTSNAVLMDTQVTSSQEVCSAGKSFAATGSRGLYQKTLVLGNQAGKLRIHYQMYTLPDRLDIRYAGQWVKSTDVRPGPPVSSRACFDGAAGYVPGVGTFELDYDPAKSRELEIYMSGCEGDTRWDIEVECPEEGCTEGCAGVTLFDAESVFTVPANQAGRFTTHLQIKVGEYVFFGSKSFPLVDKKYGTHVKAKGTNIGLDITKTSGDAIGDYFTYPASAKNYSTFRFGQLLMRFGGKLIGADEYKLITSTGPKCVGLETTIDNFPMAEEYGNYFIAPQDGTIEFEINDSNPADNAGIFMVSVVRMTRAQHENRNFCNTCPQIMPKIPLGGFGFGTTEEGTPKNVWRYGFKENGLNSNECFHGDHYVFRGESSKVLNSQCAYDQNEKLVNSAGDNTMGTYDYGAPESRDHVILDVFTHEAFAQKGANYKPTCKVY